MMGDAWGGYRNGQIPTSAMIRVQSAYFKPEVAYAISAVIAEAKKAGHNVVINEGYRPLGVPADQYIRDAAKTSTGQGGQWYEYGRMKRGETPAAAYPGGSIHGFGLAADVNPGRSIASIFNKHGFVFDIASESWHAHFVGLPKPVPEPTLSQKLFWSRMQKYLQQWWGYSGDIDGIAGKGTWTACQTWLKAHWLYRGVCDGVPGPQTYAAMQRAGCKLR
jgi:hypothetical protein